MAVWGAHGLYSRQQPAGCSVYEKSQAQAILEPVVSSSQAQHTTVLPGRLTLIPRHCSLFQLTPTSRLLLAHSSRAPYMTICPY